MRLDHYIKIPVMAVIITALGLGVGFIMCDSTYLDLMFKYNSVTEYGLLHGAAPVYGECREVAPVQGSQDPRPNTNESCGLLSCPYDRIILDKAQNYEVEPTLVSALITIESNWNPHAQSRKGAIGLMQLMPSTAREMGVRDPFNPVENIEGGIKYLRYLMDRFNGDVTLAIAAYNAGPGRIEVYQGIPPFRETQRYVKRVLNLYNSSGSSESI